MNELPESPPVTFALFAYNQEAYVRQAVESALAQDYSPLQVILSDDCSTDGTWAIIQDAAARYTGPHTVVLNRNEMNIGLTSHINKLVEKATGEMIVVAAGDDISLPDRTQRLVHRWVGAGRPPGAVHSAASVIDENGADCGRTMKGIAREGETFTIEYFIRHRREMIIHGATAAYTREVFDRFGPLLPNGLVEDSVLTLRAMLIGRLLYVPDPLVAYRVAGASLTGTSRSARRPEAWVRWAEAQSLKLENHARDYERFCYVTGSTPDTEVVRLFRRISARFHQSRDLVSKSLIRRLAAIVLFPGVTGLRDRAYFILTFYGMRRP